VVQAHPAISRYLKPGLYLLVLNVAVRVRLVCNGHATMKKRFPAIYTLMLTIALLSPGASAGTKVLVFQSDFGLKDGAVAAMKGVAVSVDARLPIFDLTHDIPAYNIWEASYRLNQASHYWPPGTVFVSVVDPGVGTARRSVVLKTRSGYYYVTPDNGSLTHVAQSQGIDQVREIDETQNRLAGSEQSYTFHGRDVYAYTGARLAAGIISFEQVGPRLPARVTTIEHQRAELQGRLVSGSIPILDPQYGNVWTNIPGEMIARAAIAPGQYACVKISEAGTLRFEASLPYVTSFGEVPRGSALLYVNSLLNVSLALNQSSFASRHNIGSGARWTIQLRACEP
jgi:S-adenosylmethionine hydrolase